jgi:hypothetical protein
MIMTDTTETITYRTAVTRGRKAFNALNAQAKFELGDLAANVESKYADDTIGKLAADIAGDLLSKSTLMNYRTTALAYAPGERDTVHGNSFSVHEKFNSLEDRVELVNSRHWSAKEARELVESRTNPQPEVDPDGEGEGEGEGAGEEPDELELAMADANRLEGELIKAWARVDTIRAKRGMPALAGADTEPQVVVHSPRGIDSHPITEPVHNCPDCQKAGIAPAAPERAGSPRRARRSRQPAAA